MTHGLIMWLIIGAIAGWLAGVLVKGGGFGLIVDIIVGIVGAVIGGWPRCAHPEIGCVNCWTPWSASAAVSTWNRRSAGSCTPPRRWSTHSTGRSAFWGRTGGGWPGSSRWA